MRLLYVTNGFPFPLTSGYLRHYHLLRHLADRHDITLLSIVGRSFEAEHRAALTPFTTSIHTFGPAPSQSPAAKARRRVEGLLHTVASQPVREMTEVARSLVTDGHFDAGVFSGKDTFPVTAALGGLPLVVDMCDATSSRLRGGLRFAAPMQRAADLLEWVEIRRIERRLVERGDHLVFASGRDRDLLVSGRDRDRSTVVANGIDLETWVRDSTTLGRCTVVFTGKMDYPPNEHAALHLIETVMPLVQRSVADAELLIVGRDPTARLRAAARPGVTVTGYVDDVRPYLERASVFAAPLHFGAGIQNKILEAMAMEVPVVASSVAADGVRASDGRAAPIAVADGPEQFAGLIVTRLLAAQPGAPPDRTARAFVEASFAWSAHADRLDDALRSAVASRAAPPPAPRMT